MLAMTPTNEATFDAYVSPSIIMMCSSGSEAILRLLETTKLGGAVVVAAYHTDLGSAVERNSGYFSRPWEWAAIRTNTPWLVQFHSVNDRAVPVEEARFVAQQTHSEYVEMQDKGHFCIRKFPGALNLGSATVKTSPRH